MKPLILSLAAALAASPALAGGAPAKGAGHAAQALLGLSGAAKLGAGPDAPAVPEPVAPEAVRVEERLLDLTRDDDPKVRAKAARALRDYASSWRVRDRLMELSRDGREELLVRAEAVKSLSRLGDSRVRDALWDLADDGREDEALRAWAAKALYWNASLDSRTRDNLRGLLDDEREPLALREAAAWGLFKAVSDWRTRDALREIAAGEREPESLRVEAIKSLYGQAGDYRVRDDLMELARDWRGSAPLAVRVAATLTLHGAKGHSRAEDLLEELSRDRAPAPVRLAAVEALRPSLSEERIRWFHLSHYRGEFRDPLD